jgi:polysaccharide transporter, PST family
MDTTKTMLKFTPSFLRRKIENNKELRKILDNINWVGGEKVVQLILTIFVSAFVARYLGPEQLGIKNYAISFVTLFSVLNTLGLDAIVVRNIVNNPNKKDEYLGSTIVLRFIGSFLLILLSLGGVMILRPNEPLIHIIVVIIGMSHLFKSFETIDLWFQSQVKSKYTVQARFIAFFTVSILNIVLVLTQQPLIAFVLIVLLDSIIASIFLVIFYQKKGLISILKWKARINTMKELLKDSWPLILSGLAVSIYMRIDQIMIGNMIGDTELGIYSVAVKLSESWYFIPMVITASVFPAILHARKKSKKLYHQRLQKLYDFSTWFTIIISLIVTLLSPFIINILFGNEYSGASTVLSIHIWAGIFVFMGVVNSKYLIPENLVKLSLYRTLIGAITNILLNIILISSYGIIGAAIATLLSYGLQAYISLLFFKKAKVLFFMITRSFNIVRIIKENL